MRLFHCLLNCTRSLGLALACDRLEYFWDVPCVILMRHSFSDWWWRFHENKLVVVEECRRVLIYHANNEAWLNLLVINLMVQVCNTYLRNITILIQILQYQGCFWASFTFLQRFLSWLNPKLLVLLLLNLLQILMLNFGNSNTRTRHLNSKWQLVLVSLIMMLAINLIKLINIDSTCSSLHPKALQLLFLAHLVFWSRSLLLTRLHHLKLCWYFITRISLLLQVLATLGLHCCRIVVLFLLELFWSGTVKLFLLGVAN